MTGGGRRENADWKWRERRRRERKKNASIVPFVRDVTRRERGRERMDELPTTVHAECSLSSCKCMRYQSLPHCGSFGALSA